MIKTRMPCLYSSAKDLTDRLHGTVCFYDGEPVTVLTSGMDDNLKLMKLAKPGELVKTIKPDDPLFDISSPPLGYLNYKRSSNNVLYMARTIGKRYKQGVNSGCCTLESISGVSSPFNIVHVWGSSGFEEMLTGVYPEIEQAFDILEQKKYVQNDGSIIEYNEVAISRSVALKREESGITLVYMRMKNVGYILPEESTIFVPNSEIGWIITRELKGFGFKVE